jgi:Peptidase M15
MEMNHFLGARALRFAASAIIAGAVFAASAVSLSTDAAAQVRGGPAIAFRAPAKCIPGSLVRVLRRVSARYGPITVNSTWRSKGKNRKIGGRGHSMHLACRAVDFRVRGSSRGLTKFLLSQKEVGGYNRYPSGFYHIDNGPRRTW